MNDKEVGLIITARVESSRLPNKVLQTIKGRRTIEILLDHVISQNDTWQTILAIPENSDDDILEKIGKQKGVEVYRGEDDSPLHRLHSVSEKYGFDYIIRITADDILIDKYLLHQQLSWAIGGDLDYCFIRRCPEGIAGEVIKAEALSRVVMDVGKKAVEFVSYYFKNDNYIWNDYRPPIEYQHTFRLTMDYPEDLKLLRELYNALPEPIGTLDIINFLRRHKTFLQINKLPTITVYTCNYNQGKYIRDCIDSVINQSLDDFEYIILDDNSTDNSMNIITEHISKMQFSDRDKIKILRNDKNIGLPDSCNKVLNLARGKFIIRVDADDMLEQTALQEMINRIRIENTQACFSAYSRIEKDGKIIAVINRNDWHPACCLLSRWCVNEIKYKSELKYMEGEDFFNKFRSDYKYSYRSNTLWKYRQHEESKTANPEHPNNK